MCRIRVLSFCEVSQPIVFCIYLITFLYKFSVPQHSEHDFPYR